VRIFKDEDQLAQRSAPQFEALKPYPGMEKRPGLLAALIRMGGGRS
jgi:hypothetical protein